MIYAGDKWAELPTFKLFNEQLALAEQNAARYMYELGQKQIENFAKQYGDFISPFAKDMDRYNQIVGKVKDTIDYLYQLGVDPLRNKLARAMISKVINSVNPAEINAMRANAKMGYAYQDALQKLAASGKYDPDMNAAWLDRMGVGSFEDFSTAGKYGFNMWNVSSPIEGISLQQLTDPLFKGMTPRDLKSYEAANILGDDYNKNKTYKGILESDLMNTAGEGIPGLMGDWRMQYFRDRVSKDVLSRNPFATAADVDRAFQRQVAYANRRYLQEPVGDYDEWATARYKNALEIGAYEAKLKLDKKYGKGDKDDFSHWNIFRESDYLNPGDGTGSEFTDLIPKDMYYQKINPINPKISYAENEKGQVAYRIRKSLNDDSNSGIYQLSEIKRKKTYRDRNSNGKEVYHAPKPITLNLPREGIFAPNSKMISFYDEKEKKNRYFIGGSIMVKKDDSKDAKMRYATGNNEDYYMEVRERIGNYGDLQKKDR